MNRRLLLKTVLSIPLFGFINKEVIPQQNKKFNFKDIYISREVMEDIRNWDTELHQKIKKEINHD